MRRCDLCGEFESEETSLCSKAGDVCYDCLNSLLENEIERRGEKAHRKAMEDGFDADTGEMRLRDEMAEARKYK